MRVRTDIRLLHDIFGFSLISKYRARRAKHPFVMPSHQHFEKRGVALQNSGNNLLVGERAETGNDRGWIWHLSLLHLARGSSLGMLRCGGLLMVLGSPRRYLTE